MFVTNCYYVLSTIGGAQPRRCSSGDFLGSWVPLSRILVHDRPALCEIIEMSEVRYHPAAAAANAIETGYVGSLTPAQTLALEQLSDRLDEHGERDDQWKEELDKAQGGVLRPLFLCRWLRAREFHVDSAFAMLCDHIQWRSDNKTSELAMLSEEDVLGCPREQVLGMCPHWVGGFDDQGRPFVFHIYDQGLDVARLLRMASIERLVRHHIWVQENLSKLVALKSRECGFVVETWCTVLDLRGMGVRQVTPSFLAMVKAFSAVDQAHYPERNGGIFILNAPGVFPMVWRGIKPMMNPRTTSKIEIHAGVKSFGPILRDRLGSSQLLPEYGGDPKKQLFPPSIIHDGTGPALVLHMLAADGGGIEPPRPHSRSAAQARRVRRGQKRRGVARGASEPCSDSASDSSSRSDSDSSFSARSSGRRSFNDAESNASFGSSSNDYFESCAQSFAESKELSEVEGREDHLGAAAELEMTGLTRRFPAVVTAAAYGRARARERARLTLQMRRRHRGSRGPLDRAIRVASVPFLRNPCARWLLAKPYAELVQLHYVANGVSVFLALVAMALGAYWMEFMVYWASSILETVMWSSVLLIVLGTIMLVVSFMAISAVHTKSVGVAVFVECCQLSALLIQLGLLAASFIFFANRATFQHAVTGVSGDKTRGREILMELETYCIHLLAYSLFSAIVNTSQIILGLLVLRRMKGESERDALELRLRLNPLAPAADGPHHSPVRPSHSEDGSSVDDGRADSPTEGDGGPRSGPGQVDGQGGVLVVPDGILSTRRGARELSRALQKVAAGDESGVGNIGARNKSPASTVWSLDNSVDGTTELELRKVLEVSNHITILFAAMSIVLGGVLLAQGLPMTDSIVTVVVGPYVMILFGVFLILAGLLGAYVANSSHLALLLFYEFFTGTIFSFLVLWATYCFYNISKVDSEVDRHWSQMEKQYDDDTTTESEKRDAASAVFKCWLLVTGICCSMLAFFQMVNFLAAHGLYQALRLQPGLHGRSQWHLLSLVDKCCYCWAVSAAIVHIIVDGTHAIFSKHITPKEWFLVFWDFVGRVDSRYSNGDACVVAMEFILAILAGPGCLVFAWSIYTKQPYRFILGTLVCSIQIYTQILYYAVTIQEGYSPQRTGYIFVIFFIIFQGLRTVLPILIFSLCLRKTVLGTKAHKASKRMLLDLGLQRRDLQLVSTKDRLRTAGLGLTLPGRNGHSGPFEDNYEPGADEYSDVSYGDSEVEAQSRPHAPTAADDEAVDRFISDEGEGARPFTGPLSTPAPSATWVRFPVRRPAGEEGCAPVRGSLEVESRVGALAGSLDLAGSAAYDAEL